MFDQSFLHLLSIIGADLLFSVLLTGLAAVYVPIYCALRKAADLKQAALKFAGLKAGLCICVNFLVVSFGTDDLSVPFIIILCLIADIDLFIRKIPTEFLIILIALTILSVRDISGVVLLKTIIPTLCFCGLWFLVRRFTDMGIYDIFLIMILSIALADFRGAVKFSALILILWGLIGLLFHINPRNEQIRKIPLAPLIVTAFILTLRFL